MGLVAIELFDQAIVLATGNDSLFEQGFRFLNLAFGLLDLLSRQHGGTLRARDLGAFFPVLQFLQGLGSLEHGHLCFLDTIQQFRGVKRQQQLALTDLGIKGKSIFLDHGIERRRDTHGVAGLNRPHNRQRRIQGLGSINAPIQHDRSQCP